MGYVDFILNVAGLLLWLNWRSIRFYPLARRTPATLMGTLRPASSKTPRCWHLLAFLGGILFFRAVVYWWLGSSVWAGKLDLGATVLSFRSDWFLRILFFSFFSFGLAMWVFCLCLLPLSILQGPETIQGLVSIPLGRVDGWPRWVKFLLPLLAGALGYWLASWLLAWLQIIPPPGSMGHRLGQSLVIGLGGYLVWKFPIGAILMLHLLNSYIYFGKNPFWNHVNFAAQKLLSPLRRLPLRFGKMDFAPVVGVILVFLFAHVAEYGIKTNPRTGEHGQRLKPLVNIPGLVDLF